jgi:hypothetical protein
MQHGRAPASGELHVPAFMLCLLDKVVRAVLQYDGRDAVREVLLVRVGLPSGAAQKHRRDSRQPTAPLS